MKKMKRFLTVILAMVMVLAMTGVVASADDADDGEYIITVSGVETANQTLVAYQIFSGQTSGGIISNVEWGVGVTAYSGTYDDVLTDEALAAATAAETELLEALNNTVYFDSVSDASDVAEILSTAADNSDVALAFAEVINNYLSTTYKTATAASSASSDGTYTYTFSGLDAGYYLVKDVTDTTNNNTSVSAYTQDILVTAGGTDTTYNNVSVKISYPTVSKSVDDANAAVGDTVTFTITGTVPDMTYYDTYQYIISDTMSAGLTYNSSSIIVYGVDKDDSTKTTLSAYDADSNPNGYVLTVTEDATDKTTSIVVSFSDLKSVSGYESFSSIVVAYSATVNSDAVLGTTSSGNTNTVTITYSNDPNWDGTGTETTSTTTEETVYVNTFELYVSKYSSDGTTQLEGAIFDLYYADNGTNYYAIVSDGQITGWTTSVTLGGDTEIQSDENGVLEIKGLDAGTYYLEELKAPDGYNLLEDPIEIVITAATGTNGMLTAGGLSASTSSSYAKIESAVSSSGIIYLYVYNNANSTLPTTGGIGTTMFYVIGIILVAGAVIVLITRRRMRAGI